MKYLFSLLLGGLLLSSCDKCGPAPDDCIDPELARRTKFVTHELNPVCGCDGKTYDNPSIAKSAGVRAYTVGECPTQTGK
jgi:hypothetical protein